MGTVMDWLRRNPVILAEHVRDRVGVIPSGVNGLALSGLTTAIAIQAPVTVLTDARAGFRQLLPEGGDALHDEVIAIVAACQGVPTQLLALRRVLAEHHGAIDLAGAAQQLGVSTRSLQRVLGDAGSSFRTEQADARFRAASELLGSDDKLAVVADRLGLSEDGLTLLVRGRTGVTPAELRKRLRGA
jgi:AraC-like DNA-binding protein